MSILVNQDAVLKQAGNGNATTTHFKTINGESIVGSGDIVVSGGSGSSVSTSLKASNHIINSVAPLNDAEIWSTKTTSSTIDTYIYPFPNLYALSIDKSTHVTQIGLISKDTNSNAIAGKIAIYASDSATNRPTGLPIFVTATITLQSAAPYFMSCDVILEAGKIYWVLIVDTSGSNMNILCNEPSLATLPFLTSFATYATRMIGISYLYKYGGFDPDEDISTADVRDSGEPYPSSPLIFIKGEWL